MANTSQSNDVNSVLQSLQALNLSPAQVQAITALFNGSGNGIPMPPQNTQNAANGAGNASTTIPAPPASQYNPVPSVVPMPGGVTMGGGGGVAVAQAGTPAHQLTCHNCGQPVTLPATDNRWYAVYVGTRVGWIRGYAIAHQLTNGVSGNQYQYFSDEQAARNAFLTRRNANAVHVVGPTTGVNYPGVPLNQGWLYP